MIIKDYDEFNIYSSIEEVENYVGKLISEGFEKKEEIYNLCLEHFGNEWTAIIDSLFSDEEDI
jgi:hypothetical protein